MTKTQPVVDIIPLELATFTFAPDEPSAGREGVVVAYAVRHRRGVILFDTGFGFGSDEVDERYHPRTGRISGALSDAGIAPSEITAVVNCHMHIDHAGQNSAFPRVPIHVQPAEWHVAHRTEHTILEWIDFAGADYRLRAGDYELAPGIEIIATPGHTPGHQSLVVRTDEGPVILAGQAVYSLAEWTGDPAGIHGRARAPDRDEYDRSVARMRALDPVKVYFAHDRAVWNRAPSTKSDRAAV